MKTVITVTGIRPDFIRMSEIFWKLDRDFNHILIHTGQHFDYSLSDVFFNELKIREPDFNLGIGGPGKEHFHQSAELGVKLIELIRHEGLEPDIILFLGDANTVSAAFPLKKEGYTIGHIEAGMRSYDRRMLEEINRTVCDHCSDHLFVYHENYKQKAMREGIHPDKIHVVGNTIVEVVNQLCFEGPKSQDMILLDVHRPENFKDKTRLKNILQFANLCIQRFAVPVKMLHFGRTMRAIEEFGLDLGNIEVVPLMSFIDYTRTVFDALFLISDSGTAQEEPAMLGTPVLVPRDFTERPESVVAGCSIMIDVNEPVEAWLPIIRFLATFNPDPSWMGDGTTSDQVIRILHDCL